MASNKKVIAIIGAGVTGLQTSISLAQANYRVVIIAKHLPGDESIEYTSPWAGGHWRSHAPNADPEQQQWDTETYKHWLEVIKNEGERADPQTLSGLALRKSRFYSISSEPPWFSNLVLDYKTTPADLLNGYQHGHTYTSFMVNAPMYLGYLHRMARSLGVVIVQAALPSYRNFSDTLQAAADIMKPHLNAPGSSDHHPISAFVNATGISASKLVPDPDVYPVRGQTVIVAGEAKQITTIDGFLPTDTATSGTPITYLLPRPHSNTTILGGTKLVGEWSDQPDPSTTEQILRQAKQWAPELLNEKGEFNVLSVQVGLRPARKGGARVEIEKLDEFVVCHAYGHAGAGFQNSVGSANKAVRLLEEYFRSTKSG